MFFLARESLGQSRVQNEGVRAALIIRRSQYEPCINETYKILNNKYLSETTPFSTEISLSLGVMAINCQLNKGARI